MRLYVSFKSRVNIPSHESDQSAHQQQQQQTDNFDACSLLVIATICIYFDHIQCFISGPEIANVELRNHNASD